MIDFAPYMPKDKKGLYDFKSKRKHADMLVQYMLARTQKIFKYNDLPETIEQFNIELLLQCNGFAGFAEFKDNLYVFNGGLGGPPNVYYLPTEFIVANPALKFNKTLTIDKDCVIVKNDSLYIGLLPLLYRYCSLLAENELSLKIALVNSRIIDIITAADDRTFNSAKAYLNQIDDGNLGVILEKSILDTESLRVNPASTTGIKQLTDLIESEQYIKASLFNELGLDNNYNMKREAIMAKEADMDSSILLPLIDDMLERRKEGIEKVNAMFGTNISVDLDSAWKKEQQEVSEEIEGKSEEIEENAPEETEGNA